MARMNGFKLTALALLATAALGAAAAPNSIALERTNLRMIGLTADQRLISFRERNPAGATSIGFVTGLGGGDTALVGIDYRVQDGRLYGVGNAGGVYVIDGTAAATFVNRVTVALSGTTFGVDFNPAADRLRIVSDTGQNLRHNLNTGATIADLPLNYTAGVTASGITGAAYTNNDLSASTSTTLFDLDSTLDQVAIQAPPNNGSLSATGKLGGDAVGSTGFDIYTTPRGGVASLNKGYAVATGTEGVSALYAVNLLTGRARSIGAFDEAAAVVDLAIPLAQH